jgi:hypothetical protein
MKKIDLVIIATIRPKIFKLTLESFYKNLLRFYKVRVIINVDPIGESNHFQHEIIDICKEYFEEIETRLPNSASFPKAVQWAWSKVETDIFFHLEDDWILKREVSKTIIDQAFRNEKVVSVRLNISDNNKTVYDQNYIYGDRFSLNPSFFRSQYIKEKLMDFDQSKDPEKQFSSKLNSKSFDAPVFLIFGKQGQKSIVIDTGKKWRNSQGLQKWNLKSNKEITWSFNKVSLLKSSYQNLKYKLFLKYWFIIYCR